MAAPEFSLRQIPMGFILVQNSAVGLYIVGSFLPVVKLACCSVWLYYYPILVRARIEIGSFLLQLLVATY